MRIIVKAKPIRIRIKSGGEEHSSLDSLGGERIYVQASYIIADDATREREFGNLRAIKDNYPKYVISMTPLLTKNDDDGITHLHLRKFLTEGMGV